MGKASPELVFYNPEQLSEVLYHFGDNIKPDPKEEEFLTFQHS